MTEATTPANDSPESTSLPKRGWIGLVQVGSCASAAYFDELAMEREMRRAAERRASQATQAD
jgi:hypothetical protein